MTTNHKVTAAILAVLSAHPARPTPASDTRSGVSGRRAGRGHRHAQRRQRVHPGFRSRSSPYRAPSAPDERDHHSTTSSSCCRTWSQRERPGPGQHLHARLSGRLRRHQSSAGSPVPERGHLPRRQSLTFPTATRCLHIDMERIEVLDARRARWLRAAPSRRACRYITTAEAGRHGRPRRRAATDHRGTRSRTRARMWSSNIPVIDDTLAVRGVFLQRPSRRHTSTNVPSEFYRIRLAGSGRAL